MGRTTRLAAWCAERFPARIAAAMLGCAIPLVARAQSTPPATARAAAQSTATVTGTIRDATSDSAVAGATVLLVGTPLSARSDASGAFQISGVPPGRYLVRVLSLLYVSDTASTGDLTPGARHDLAFRLQPAPLMLTGVVVTTDRGPQSATESPVSVAVLPQREILNRDVTYLEDALPYVAGLTFNGGGQLDIRGSTGTAQGVGSRVLMLLDGHPILSADGGEIIWESLPLLDIERVEVVKSAFSAVYGSNALGGVVNIITSPISDTTETLARVHYDAYQVPSAYRYTSSRLGTEGAQLLGSRWIGGVGARLEVGREASTGYYENGGYDRWFGRAKFTSSDSSTHPWDAYAIYSRNRSGNFLTWASSAEPFEVDSAYLGDRSVYAAVYTGGSLTPLVTSSSVLRITPYLNFNENQDHFHTDPDYHRALKPGASVQVTSYVGAANTVLLGGDGAYTAVTSNFLGASDADDGGLFAQDEFDLSPRLSLTGGGRLDYHSTTRSEAESSFNPKLALHYAATDWLALRASVGRGYRAPSAIEQFVSAVQFGYRVIPNPDLHGEHAVSSEVGAVVTPHAGMQLDAAVFESDYRDLIGPAAVPDSAFVFQFRNVQEARIRGADASWRSAIVPERLDLDLTYLYLDAIDTRTGQWLPYRSRHTVTASLDVLRGLAGVDVRYRSRVESVLVYPLDPRGDITVVDLRANLPLWAGVLQAKVSNLFNRFYTDVEERTPGAPRNFSLGVLRSY